MIHDLKKYNELFLSDPYNYMVFRILRDVEVYVVGGYIRDVIMGKKVFDRDYIVKGDLKKIAAQIVAEADGKLIRIGNRDLYRVLLNNGISMDFTPIAVDVREDLSKRDFTINAIAWSPKTGLIDLHGGVEDINNGLINAIKKENLCNDPVRIIRAYRISGETSLVINEKTQKILKEIGYKIKQAKTERITLEFFRILNLYDPFILLKTMLEYAILTHIICLSNSELMARLKVLNDVNGIIHERSFKDLLKLSNVFSQNLSYQGLLRLEVLLMGSPVNSLNLSLKVMKRLIDVEKACKIIRAMKGNESEVLFDAFRIAGDASLDLLIINNLMKKLPDLRRFEKLQKKALLSVYEIMNIIGIDKGLILGKAKEFIIRAEFTGKIRTKKEAIESLKENFPISSIQHNISCKTFTVLTTKSIHKDKQTCQVKNAENKKYF